MLLGQDIAVQEWQSVTGGVRALDTRFHGDGSICLEGTQLYIYLVSRYMN